MAGVYVHVPFCGSRCLYCDFYSTLSRERAEAWLDAVEHEWQQRRAELDDAPVTTLYIGGGTPSQLPPSLLVRLLALFPEAEEVTVECNPEDVTDALATTLAGLTLCNRVSLGVQSLVDSELRAVGRRHSARRALDAITALQRAGIANISGDLIWGLPGQTVATLGTSLTALLDSGITHLSAYMLTYEEGTPLTRRRDAGIISEATDDTLLEMYALLCSTTGRYGMHHYEISSYARPGMHSRHNSAYWDLTPYLGLGPGAHSYTRGMRSHNPADLDAYIAAEGHVRIDDPETVPEQTDDLLITRLRTARGLRLADIPLPYRDDVMRAARPYIAAGDMLHSDGTLTLTEEAWMRSDAILRSLLVG